MSLLLAIMIGAPACVLGLALGIYSSIKSNRIVDYTVTHGLAPNLTRSPYVVRIFLVGVYAAYTKATGDRRGVVAIYVTGALGVLFLLSGGMLVITNPGLH